ncbi:hypothetical protein UPYG_G00166130 [Umbra pygmaea]|uniref:C2H2-type domain-containing protein n=1 Tax=Umbra pygmaea TaxID=75934 RepID=A0ABD0WSA8_UMBPY
MSKLELLNIFLNERLTAVAEEIFGAVQGTIVEYQTEIVRSKEENDRLRKLLDIAVQQQRVLIQSDGHESQLIEEAHSLDQPSQRENSSQLDVNNIFQRGLSEYKAPLPQGTNSRYERESIDLHIHVRGQNVSKQPQQRSPYQPQGIQRLYRCRECGKSFNFSCQLEVHMRWHSKERPFVCSVCKKGFTTISMLRRHHRIHTGEKPFRCHVCGKCFNQSAHLNTHFKIHPGERPQGWKMAQSKQ